MTDEDFRQIIEETLDRLPEEFRNQLDNVEIVIEDTPRDVSSAAVVLPDRIACFLAYIKECLRQNGSVHLSFLIK